MQQSRQSLYLLVPAQNECTCTRNEVEEFAQCPQFPRPLHTGVRSNEEHKTIQSVMQI